MLIKTITLLSRKNPITNKSGRFMYTKCASLAKEIAGVDGCICLPTIGPSILAKLSYHTDGYITYIHYPKQILSPKKSPKFHKCM